MNERERRLVERLFDYVNHYIFVVNKEPEPSEVFEIASLEKDRDIVRAIRKELLGQNYQ